MNNQQQKEQDAGVRDQGIRAALVQHWAASDAVNATYRTSAPATRAKSGLRSCTMSIMEFSGDKIMRETQYFADPFVVPALSAQWVERMDK